MKSGFNMNLLTEVFLGWYKDFNPTIVAECSPTLVQDPVDLIIPVLTSWQFGRFSTEKNLAILTDSRPAVKSAEFDL